MSVTPDSSSQYIPMMNSIFASQKQNVTIDVLKVFGDDTVFLQQAAHLTKGIYFGLGSSDELLVTLMVRSCRKNCHRFPLLLETRRSLAAGTHVACWANTKRVSLDS